MDKRESLTGLSASESGEMWQDFTEEEQMEYKAKWSKLTADWKRDVLEWEERNADNPKMIELKANKIILKTA